MKKKQTRVFQCESPRANTNYAERNDVEWFFAKQMNKWTACWLNQHSWIIATYRGSAFKWTLSVFVDWGYGFAVGMTFFRRRPPLRRMVMTMAANGSAFPMQFRSLRRAFIEWKWSRHCLDYEKWIKRLVIDGDSSGFRQMMPHIVRIAFGVAAKSPQEAECCGDSFRFGWALSLCANSIEEERSWLNQVGSKRVATRLEYLTMS